LPRPIEKNVSIHSSRKKSTIGLALIAVVFTFAIIPGLQSFNNVGDHIQETASINSGDCGYRLIKNTKIVGTMFLAEPATIDEILLQAGEKNRYHFELTKVFPCGSVIDLTDGRISLVGRLSCAQILACGKRIDLNEAGETDLANVPGIGETLARKIVEYRNSVGGFSSPSEISRVKGIGPRKAQNFLRYFK